MNENVIYSASIHIEVNEDTKQKEYPVLLSRKDLDGNFHKVALAGPAIKGLNIGLQEYYPEIPA